MICEATNSDGSICNNKPRFKIMDIECEFDKDDSIFWVCEECIKFFIPENVDNPHYILLKELCGERK